MIKRIKILLGVLICVVMCLCTSCSDDEKDTPIQPDDKEHNKPSTTDVMLADMERGGISQEEFEQKVLGKLWGYSKGENSLTYVDILGNVFTPEDYSVDGWFSERGYYFDNNKCVVFLNNLYGDPLYERKERKYKYDPATGMVYYFHTDKNQETYKYELFYIESVTDDELIIHDHYFHWYVEGLDNPSAENEDCIARRCVLTPVPADKAQSEWWDFYELTQTVE